MNPKSTLGGVVVIIAIAIAAYRTLKAPAGGTATRSVSHAQPAVAPSKPAPAETSSPAEKKPSESTQSVSKRDRKPAEKAREAKTSNASCFYAGRPVFDVEKLTFLENVGYATGYSESKMQPLW